MPAGITVQIDDAAIRQALSDPQLARGPVRRFLRKAALEVKRKAKLKVPVDTGHLRRFITHEVGETEARVGSNVVYAPFVEFGTRPHWPPRKAMQPWARRHGFPKGNEGATILARIIAKRGTKPQPYLRPALEESLSDIREFLVEAAREIEARWARG